MDQHHLRLIDANANRAREGIRTAEDYIRFQVGETYWSRSLKTIRRSITELLQQHFSDRDLLSSRNVSGDPGKPGDCNLKSSVERKVEPKSVAHRGLKRGQEALRVLEEYMRGEFSQTSLQFEKHRYALYEAEQWLLFASDAAGILARSSVYVLLTQSLCRSSLIDTGRAVLKGGCKILQLREKEGTDESLLRQACDLHKLCKEHNAVLICNDRVDLAELSKADGVHVGQNDLCPTDVRRLSGSKLIVGRSTHSTEQVRRAVEVERADYIAIGSMYATSTKREHILAGVKLAEQVSAMRLNVPVFAIGGITEDRLGELRSAGVRQIAISSAIISDPNPEEATRRFVVKMGQ
jgi:thiamine-phosphate pyrophosphorylase